MFSFISKLLDKPTSVIGLVIGAALVAFPCVTIDSPFHLASHPPSTLVPVAVGIVLLIASSVAFWLTLYKDYVLSKSAGLDLTKVSEKANTFWTTVGNCKIQAVTGRIEGQERNKHCPIVLPCNEYFDDECAHDPRSALGAYVKHVFEGEADTFISLVQSECKNKLKSKGEYQKTNDIRAESFGAGQCVLLLKPLGRSVPVALVSTTTRRGGEGLSGRISYLFDGMRELVALLADKKISEFTMPVLGAGHGGISPSLAFVGLVLAIAEAARYGQGAQTLRKVTIVVFKKDSASAPEVDPVVIRRALALIAS